MVIDDTEIAWSKLFEHSSQNSCLNTHSFTVMFDIT